MAAYTYYPSNVPQYRTHRRTTSPLYHDQPACRSPFPHEGTPLPTIRGTTNSLPDDYQRVRFVDSPRPYPHMTNTQAWVLEQEHVRTDKEKQRKKTQRWVFEQRDFFLGGNLIDKDDLLAAWEDRTRRHMWDELVYAYELEADRWMRQEEEMRRLAVERERTKARYVQEEFRRLEIRMRQKREAERQRMVQENLRFQMEARERDRKERSNLRKAIVDAWNKYEAGWQALITSTAPLAFEDIPWPTKSVPTEASDITPSAIVNLLLSPYHSLKQTRKERLRTAQLRWHPDRFRRWLNRVKEEDREAVEEGIGIIARCLNDLMSKE